MAQASSWVQVVMDNEEENDRLAEQHEIFKDAMGGKLVLAPVDLSGSAVRVLDSGASDGLWLRELASSIPFPPGSIFIGTDINGQWFPEKPPCGVSFQIQNINEPWPEDWVDSFDLVHQKLTLVNAGAATKEAVIRLTELVKPNGWIQLTEADVRVGEHDGPAMHDFLDMLKEVLNATGTSHDYGLKLSGDLKEAGFLDVEERVLDYYLGALNHKPQLAQQGISYTAKTVKGIVDFLKTLSRPLAIPEERLDTLATRLKAELAERGGYLPHRVVWGRKSM